MTIAQIIALLVCSAPAAVLVAQVDPVMQVQLSSENWVERAAAVEQLASQKSRSAETEALFVRLLARENATVDQAYQEGVGASAKFGEEYGEYVAKLGDIVQAIAEKNPRMPGIWSALINTPYDPGSQFADWLAAHGQNVFSLLLEASKSKEAVYRGNALEVLAKILVYNLQQTPSGSTREMEKTIRASLRAGLTDGKPIVRMQAASALGRVGTPADIAALDKVAATDPETQDGPANPPFTGFPVRDYARAAAQKIRDRAAVSR